MPDWSYRTVLRPLMLGLGPERARRLALSALRAISRVPAGPRLIDFLGHMLPPSPAGCCGTLRWR